MNNIDELERQIQNLISKGYPEVASMTDEEFIELAAPLKNKIKEITSHEVDLEKGHLPFVIVVKNNLVPTEKAMSLVEKKWQTRNN